MQFICCFYFFFVLVEDENVCDFYRHFLVFGCSVIDFIYDFI